MVVAAYRDRTSVTDYTLAGLLTGSLFKASLGVKGAISGGFFGAAMGTLVGGTYVIGMKLAGVSMKELAGSTTSYLYARDRAVHGTSAVSVIEIIFHSNLISIASFFENRNN